MPDVRLVAALLEPAGMTDDGDNIIHFNPWRDFNDAPAVTDDDPFDLEPDPAQIGVFLDVVFGYCEGWIPCRGFIDKGQGFDGRPHNIWVEADDAVRDKAVNFAAWAAREGAAFYVVPGTVPLLVTEDGEIVAGHGRLLAARHLGLPEVPVIRLSHLGPEQVRAYRVADN